MSPATRADESLLRNLRAGKRSAFERLYGDYHAPLYNLCARMLGDREEAEDVTQEVFIKAFRKLPGEEVRALRPWLYRVATNACLNQLRSRKGGSGDGDLIEAIPARVDGFEQAQTVAYVERTLAQLSDRYRAALVLKDLQGLPSQEIADVLELPRGGADVLVHRARAAFRRVFVQVAGERPAPANLGLVLAPLAVPAALRAMPPLVHIAASSGLLAKLSAAFTSKLVLGAAAATLVVGGGIAADRLMTNSPDHLAGAAGTPVAAATSAPPSRHVPYHMARLDSVVQHWAGHGCPPGESCHGTSTHDLDDAGEHVGSTHDATAHHDSGDATHATSGRAADSTHASDATSTAAHDDTDHSLGSTTTTSGGDSHDSSHDGGSE
jgi:RNA polymerase sigma-70 factor (ECF subfamily)